MSRTSSFNKNRMKHLDMFIDLTIKGIINQKIEENLKSRHIKTEILTNKLAQTFKKCLDNEKEHQIQDLIDQLDIVTAERNKLQIENSELLKKRTVQNEILEDQNLVLREKCEEMSRMLQFYEEKMNFLYDETTAFNEQRNALKKYSLMLRKAKSTCALMKEDLNNLKHQTAEDFEKQKRFLHSALSSVSKQPKSFNIQKIEPSSDDKTENSQLRNVCSTILRTLLEAVPNSPIFRKVSVSELIRSRSLLRDVECAIREIPKSMRRETINNIKRGLKETYPNYEFILSETNINSIIKEIVTKEVAVQNGEYGKQLRHLQKKEKQLRKKLQNVAEEKQQSKEEERGFDWDNYRKTVEMRLSELDSSSTKSKRSSKLRERRK